MEQAEYTFDLKATLRRAKASLALSSEIVDALLRRHRELLSTDIERATGLAGRAVAAARTYAAHAPGMPGQTVLVRALAWLAGAHLRYGDLGRPPCEGPPG